MNTVHSMRKSRDGFAVVTAVVLLGLAGFTLGSILTAQMTYGRNMDRSFSREKAAFLADAGLAAAVVKLNAENEGNITWTQSRDYFACDSGMTAPDWGFQTVLWVTNSKNMVTSTGRYKGLTVQAQVQVSLGSGTRSIHALYAHALFAGNSGGNTNYNMQVGGTGTAADFVKGDTYSGAKLTLSGDANLRLPEILCDTNYDGVCNPGETWTNAYTLGTFTNALSQSNYNAYVASVAAYSNKFYRNDKYDLGEPYVDTIGNGVYDVGEPFTDSNHNGVRDVGDSFIDRNGNGVYNAGVDTVVDQGNGQWDAGEEWTEDSAANHHNKRKNGTYDPAGGYYLKSGSTYIWTTARYKVSGVWYYPNTWGPEAFEDVGDGVYSAAEPYTDQNGVYDPGEQYLDDRNTTYDYGTQAKGRTTGMPSPGPGQKTAPGGDAPIDPPDLSRMYYSIPKTNSEPEDALSRWGNDVLVNSNDFGTAKAITDSSKPEHVFVRNPPTSGSVSSGGKTIYGRTYTSINDINGSRIDDYFFEDPTDSSYNSSVSADSIDGTTYTAPMYVNVKPEHNVMLYYVEGNVYLHHPQVYSLRFRQPDTRITIVARGNITVSDEFYYKANYAAGLAREDVNSTIVNEPNDALCLIALYNPNCPSNSGNIYIGDRQFGTGGSIHAMLYAEKDFIDNNINSVDQQFISVFGNMSAGDEVRVNRVTGGGTYRTRLDVSLDERIRNGEIVVPGLPHPVGSQRSITVDTAWQAVSGTWKSWSMLR